MRQLIMYGMVGVGGTLCHYGVLIALVELNGLDAVMASSYGFLVGALVNHELNRKFVFCDTSVSRGASLGRFLLVASFGFLLNFGIMFVLVEILSVFYILAQILATLAVFLKTFALNKAWTFQV